MISIEPTMMLLLGVIVIALPLTGALFAFTPYLMPKRECFAVTVPDAAQADPYLRRLKRAFTAKVLGLTAALTLLSALSLAFASPQAFLAVLCPALLVLMVAGYALMLRSRAKVRTYKRERGWKAAGEQMTALVADESFPKPLSLWWCLLYVPVILLTLAIGLAGYGAMPERIPMQVSLDGAVTRWADKSPGVVAFPVIFAMFMAACFTLGQWSILRSKKGSDPTYPAASTWAYGMFAHAQSILILGMGLLASLIGPLMQLAFVGVLTLAQTLVPLVAIVAIILVATLAVSVVYGQNGSRLIARMEASDAMARDDDRFWKLGIFYVNRGDASLFLPERFGIGWTINWGRPAAWALTAGFVLVTAAFVAATLLLT